MGSLLFALSIWGALVVYGWLNNRHEKRLQAIANKVGECRDAIKAEGDRMEEYAKDLREINNDVLLPIGKVLMEMREIPVDDRRRIVAYVKWMQEQTWRDN